MDTDRPRCRQQGTAVHVSARDHVMLLCLSVCEQQYRPMSVRLCERPPPDKTPLSHNSLLYVDRLGSRPPPRGSDRVRRTCQCQFKKNRLWVLSYSSKKGLTTQGVRPGGLRLMGFVRRFASRILSKMLWVNFYEFLGGVSFGGGGS